MAGNETTREALRDLQRRAAESQSAEELRAIAVNEVPDRLQPGKGSFIDTYYYANPYKAEILEVLQEVFTNPSWAIAKNDGDHLNLVMMNWPMVASNPALIFQLGVLDPGLVWVASRYYARIDYRYEVFGSRGSPFLTALGTKVPEGPEERMAGYAIATQLLESFVPGIPSLPPQPRGKRGQLLAAPGKAWTADLKRWKEEAGAWLQGRPGPSPSQYLDSIVSVAKSVSSGSSPAMLTRFFQTWLPYIYDFEGEGAYINRALPVYLSVVRQVAALAGQPMPNHLLASVFP